MNRIVLFSEPFHRLTVSKKYASVTHAAMAYCAINGVGASWKGKGQRNTQNMLWRDTRAGSEQTEAHSSQWKMLAYGL